MDSVDAKTLATWLGITPNRINALARDGVIPRDGRKFPLQKCVSAYCEWCRQNPGGRPRAEGGQADQKERLTAAQADLAELKLAEARGELLPVSEVRQTWIQIVVDLRAGLLALSPRISAAAGLDRDAAARLDAELHTALESLANDHE